MRYSSSAQPLARIRLKWPINLRAEGKIYVVVTIILIVLAGLIFYLFLLDKKVKKLEKLVSDKKKQTN